MRLGLIAAVRPKELCVLEDTAPDPAQEIYCHLAVLLCLAPPRKHKCLAFLPHPTPPHAPARAEHLDPGLLS